MNKEKLWARLKELKTQQSKLLKEKSASPQEIVNRVAKVNAEIQKVMEDIKKA